MKLRAPTYAEVASTLALTLALGTGGAYAAAQITSLDIAKNAVTTKHIKNGTVKEKDLNKAVKTKLNAASTGVAGPAGPTGATGATGPAGAQGPRGFSAWDTIPSGVTVKGQEFMDLDGTGWVNVSLPGVAPAPLSNASVNWATDGDADTADDDATCTGSYANPTAPAGKVCLYHDGAGQGDATNISGLAWVNAALRTRAFYAQFIGGSPGGVYFTWAYTAP